MYGLGEIGTKNSLGWTYLALFYGENLYNLYLLR